MTNISKNDKAIEVLQTWGWSLGDNTNTELKQFTRDDAYEIATEVAMDQAIEQFKPDEGEYISFCGDENCEDCSGWNGVAYRCECGNSRVCWSYDGDFENIFVYATAC